MTDLELLQSKVPGYPDHGDVDRRHEADRRIRAFLGEALSEARDRLRPDGEIAPRIEALLEQTEFTDQSMIKAADRVEFNGGLFDRVHAVDRKIVESAERIRTAASIDDLAREIENAAGALEERVQTIESAAPPEENPCTRESRMKAG